MPKANSNLKSFSLFETLLSLIILSITISGFGHLFTTNTSYQTYKELQTQENQFILTGQVNSTDKIKFIQFKNE